MNWKILSDQTNLMDEKDKFQKIINMGLKWLNVSRMHIDGDKVNSKNLDDNVSIIRIWVEKTSQYGLKITFHKVFFAQEYIKLLGRLTDRGRIQFDPGKTKNGNSYKSY